MRLLAGLSAGVLVYLMLGSLVGLTPSWLKATRPRRRRGAGWQDWLNQTGSAVTVRQVGLTSLAAAAMLGGLVLVLVGVPALSFLAALAGLAVPLTALARRRRSLVAARTRAWPDALHDLITHLRANLSIHGGLCQLAKTGPEPLRPYFDRYRALSGALDQRSALEVVREELADPLSDRVIEVVLVAFEQGPSVVVDILEDLAVATVGDLRLVEEVETAQLETKLEARAAAVLPFVVLALLCATSDDYQAFYRSSTGWMVVFFGGLLSLIGLVVISRLGRLPGEERTLAGGAT